MNFLHWPRGGTLNPTHLFSYEDPKFRIQGENGFSGEAPSGSPWMRPQEEKQDTGMVEDFLEFNWEHRGMNRGSEGILL